MSEAANIFKSLSPRRQEVINLYSRGKSQPGVARYLGIAAKTVEGYAESVRTQFRARTLNQVVAMVCRADVWEEQPLGHVLPLATTSLTYSQQVVLYCASEGQAASESAGILGIREKAASEELAVVRGRLAVFTTAQALRVAHEHNMLPAALPQPDPSL